MTQKEAFLYHFEHYPEMTPQDAVKLAYQSEYGCGHMTADTDGARLMLSRELASVGVRTPRAPVTESLGESTARVNLAPLGGALSEGTLFSIFYESAKLFSGSDESFEARLNVAREIAEAGRAPFTRGSLDAYIEAYRANGGGPVHHSARYSAAYSPSYRVIHARYAVFLPAFCAVDRLLSCGMSAFAVVIDGRCGSGKTTLSSLLSQIYGCGTVHADDFYLPFSSRKNALGGLDAERMSRELCGRGGAFTYRAFDPHKNEFAAERTVGTLPFFVIEGSYSREVCRRAGIEPALSIFLTVGGDEQRSRIFKRSPEKLRDFTERWIPAEEKYFYDFNVPEGCDLVIGTD